MRIVDYTDFQSGIAQIPIHDVSSDVGIATISVIRDWIDVVQPDVLVDLLGQDFYDILMTELDKETPDAKWLTLKTQLNPLKYFVWAKWYEHKQTLATSHGEVDVKSENLNRRNAIQRITEVYNIGVNQLEVAYDWLVENKDDYPDYTDIGFDFEIINKFGI